MPTVTSNRHITEGVIWTHNALPPTVIMCVCVCLFRILWILLAVDKWHTVFAVCLAYPISWVLCVVTFVVFYFKGNWLHGQIKSLGMPSK